MQFDPTLVQTRYESPLGEMCLAASSRGLVGAWFTNQRYLPAAMDGPKAWAHDGRAPLLRRAVQQLKEYFAAKRRAFDIPLDLGHGTAFQQSVWKSLLGITAGATSTYAALGAQVGKPGAARAIGGAVGHNTISIIVPCHRIIGADGSLTGYAGGLERKTALLKLEGAL